MLPSSDSRRAGCNVSGPYDQRRVADSSPAMAALQSPSVRGRRPARDRKRLPCSHSYSRRSSSSSSPEENEPNKPLIQLWNCPRSKGSARIASHQETRPSLLSVFLSHLGCTER